MVPEKDGAPDDPLMIKVLSINDTEEHFEAYSALNLESDAHAKALANIGQIDLII